MINIFNKLESTKSKNDKISILKEFANIDLMRTFELALNPYKTYGYTSLPEPNEFETSMSLNQALDVLESNFLGHQRSLVRTALLSGILGNLSKDDADIFSRVILKDLKCGVGITLTNKAWSKHIPVFNVLLAQPGKEKNLSRINYPAYSQIKYDGGRVNIELNEFGETSIFTRNGRHVELYGLFDDEFPDSVFNNMLDGELIAMRNGVKLPRSESNGLVNKAIRGTITPEESKLLHFVCWDIIKRENFKEQTQQDTSCEIRYNEVVDKLTGISSKFSVAYCKIVNSLDEAIEHFNECLESGEEGIIIKNLAGVWKPKRSNDLVKMKAEEMADLIIVALNEGDGKYVGMLGAFSLETSDGLLKTNCGSGLTDELRVKYWDELYVGKIVEVKYNELIRRKQSKTMSMFLPIFKQIRYDKDIANKLDELK